MIVDVHIDTGSKPKKRKDNNKVLLKLLVVLLCVLIVCLTLFAFLLFHPEQAPAVFGNVFEKLADLLAKQLKSRLYPMNLGQVETLFYQALNKPHQRIH